MRVETGGGDAVIGRVELPPIAGKAHFMPLRPAAADQRIDQPAVARIDIAVEKGPDMIAADMIGLLDQQDARARPPLGKGKRDQPPGKAPADNRKIAFQISHSPC